MASERGQLSMRPTKRILKGLRDRARLTGQKHTTLAERYLDEGLKMDEHPGIHFEDHPMGRVPRVKGYFRIPTIIEVFKDNRSSIEETAAYWEVDPWVVEAAVRYYAGNREEIDDWIARNEEFNEREYAKWRAAQEIASA